MSTLRGQGLSLSTSRKHRNNQPCHSCACVAPVAVSVCLSDTFIKTGVSHSEEGDVILCLTLPSYHTAFTLVAFRSMVCRVVAVVVISTVTCEDSPQQYSTDLKRNPEFRSQSKQTELFYIYTYTTRPSLRPATRSDVDSAAPNSSTEMHPRAPPSHLECVPIQARRERSLCHSRPRLGLCG